MPDKNIIELVSKKYSDSELTTIAQLEVTAHELDKQYPIECVREIGNSYRVSYLGNKSVAIVSFDDNENKIIGKVYTLNLTKEDFNELVTGQSLESVQTLDPKGEYLFMYTGSNNAPKISTHCTIDGYLIIVEYDEKNNVLNVRKSLI